MRYVLIDRITALDPGRTLTAIKNVSLSDDLVARHAPGMFVLPASMVLEAMAQAAGLLVVASVRPPAQPVLAKLQPFTAHAPALAGDRVELHADLQDLREEGASARVTASVDGRLIAEATIYLALISLDGPGHTGRVALLRGRLSDTFPGWFATPAAVGMDS